MKKAILPLILMSSFLMTSCSSNQYVMNENTFFLVMTNIQFYPEDYINKELTFDCFTYQLTSVSGDEYLCVVRKCSSGFGCKCGKDTIIGFIVDKELGLPEPKNQYDNSNDKAWVHIVGELTSADKTTFDIYNDYGDPESVSFLSLEVKDFSVIDDYSNLHYYVDK